MLQPNFLTQFIPNSPYLFLYTFPVFGIEVEFALTWYVALISLAVLGFYVLIPYVFFRAHQQQLENWDSIFLILFLGTMAGAKIGYALFYYPLYYLQNPWALLDFARGGMSFHGGLIGLTLALLLAQKFYKFSFWALSDTLAFLAPFGIFCGRIANFLMGELYGRPCVSLWAWCTTFPAGGMVLRHPSQIYEALGEGLFLFCILFVMYNKKAFAQKGKLTFTFGFFYALIRFVLEFWREKDVQTEYIYSLTRGQIFCMAQAFTFSVGLLIHKIKSVKKTALLQK